MPFPTRPQSTQELHPLSALRRSGLCLAPYKAEAQEKPNFGVTTARVSTTYPERLVLVSGLWYASHYCSYSSAHLFVHDSSVYHALLVASLLLCFAVAFPCLDQNNHFGLSFPHAAARLSLCRM